MSIIIQSPFTSAVVEANEDVFSRSYIKEENTIIEFDMRKRDYQKEAGISGEIHWPEKTYNIDVHEFSTFHNPILYRFISAQGWYYDNQGNRVWFSPKIGEISTQQHVTKNVIRLACFLAVICGVTLRNISTIFTVLFQIPVSKSSVKRWIDEIGSNLPSEEEILKRLVELKKPEQCHIDGYYPMGTNNCVMVIKDEFDRILITNEVESENGDDARKFLQKLKDAGINIVSAFSDYSKSFVEAIKDVFPEAKFQGDHFHTVKNIWKNLKNCLLEYRRKLKADGQNKQDKEMLEIALELWKLRWTLLKKPSNLSEEECEKIKALEKRDSGFISKFRSVISQIVNIFDHSNTEIQAEIKLKNLKNQIEQLENSYLDKIVKFFSDHWNEAMQYLRKKGLAKYPRSSNSESGMRVLRRLEKNHDGIRSAETRKHYIKIYQAITYLSVDVADFIRTGIEPKNVQNTS
jgi:hypothetical protein